MAERKAIVKRDSAQFAAVCEAVLERGAKVRFRANGLSMRPNILNEDAVTVEAMGQEELRIGDVALTRARMDFACIGLHSPTEAVEKSLRERMPGRNMTRLSIMYSGR